MDELRLKAMAKINLGLDVVRKREDGYHDLRMIMQSVYLYDQIELVKTEERSIRVSTNLNFLPTGEDNLVYKAAKLLMDEFEIRQGVTISLKKCITVAAGLAGGSSDAAAVLVGVNRMFQLGLSKKDLMERGVKIGADVPYCIMRGTVLAEGIGEELTALPAIPACTVLIAKPPISVSTKAVYEALDAEEGWDHPDIDGIMEGLETGSLEKIASCMGNVLEQVTVEAYPVIEAIKDAMKEQGALNAMMSGSGPTVFGIFETKADAKRAREAILRRKLARQVYVANVHNTWRR